MMILLSLPVSMNMMKAMDKSGKETFTKEEVTSMVIDAFVELESDHKLSRECKSAKEFTAKKREQELDDMLNNM